MDIQIIENTIDELEHSDISMNNAIELASLYIIRNNNLTGRNKEETGGIRGEIEDILPAYTEYRQVKTQYQLNNLPDFVVVKTLKLLCQEIEDVINLLYSSTDMHKERKCIKAMITELYQKYVENT